MKNHEVTDGSITVWVLVFLGAMLIGGLIIAYDACAQEKMWDVALEWPPNTETDLKEYKLWENGVHIDTIPAGTETTDRTLEAGDYEWYLTARDLSLNESGPSNTVSLSLDEISPDLTGTTINITIGIHINP